MRMVALGYQDAEQSAFKEKVDGAIVNLRRGQEGGGIVDQPNYVLKMNEAVLVPVKRGRGFTFLKTGVWIVVAIIVLGSLVFRESLFWELSWTARILLVVLAAGVTFAGEKTEWTPSPMELQFFDDYLIFYEPKRYYSRRVIRKDIAKMPYAGITKIVFKTQSQRMHIYGAGTCTWYTYRKDGTLPEAPTKIKNTDDGLIYFCTHFIGDLDLKAEIESHSPLQVIVENS